MKFIESGNNQYIKFVRGLKTTKARKKSGKFFIEGIHLVDEAIKNEYPIESVLYCPEILRSDYAYEIIEKIEESNIEIIRVTNNIFVSFANKEGPQGIAAVGIQRYLKSKDTNVKGLWIGLENIQDPGNLGTILRSLDGAGGKGAILIGKTTNPFHPSAVRSSTGALFTIPITHMSKEEFILWKTSRQIFTVGAICENVVSYRSVKYPQDLILLMGSEQKGLSKDLSDSCDQLITIPMGGNVDSLNLSNATSIVLFEIYAKRHEE